jgi:glycolate oxidase FAD binding subunit
MNDDIGIALATACGSEALVRAAGSADTVGGRTPGWVVAPGTVEALAAVMRTCTEQELTVVARGEGTKLDWGQSPSTVDVLLDTGRLAGIYHHYSDDLVVTVGAGTPVRSVQAVLSHSGQRLAIDPPSSDATIGGVLATGEAGPLRLGHGMPRDQLLGIEFVRPDGVIAHAGGRVVKNVAGYDLGKLMCGSFGTLGIITAATFRLQPVPAARAWVTRTVATPLEVRDLADAVLGSPLTPAAIEVDLPPLSDAPAIPHQRSDSDVPGIGTLAILLEGSTDGVEHRVAAMAALLGGDATPHSAPPEWWGRYPFEPNTISLKIAAPMADLHAAIYALRDAVGAMVAVRGSAGVGVVHAALPANGAEAGVIDIVRHTLIARGGSCVVLDAPAGAREVLDMWGPVSGIGLMRAVKQQFDPRRRLAPGRFVGGI